MFAEALAAGSIGGCFFRLIEQFHTQNEPAFCGLGTLTMVLNTLNVDPKATWKGPWRWFHEDMLSCCEPLEVIKQKGIIWPKWVCLARCNSVFVEAHRADEAGGDLESFRRAVRATTSQVVGSCDEEKEPLKVLVVSYSRKQFKQTGDGHFSPIGGYHAESDSVLVLDVARFKHPPHWVKLSEMHESMKRLDPETGRSRGFAMLSACQEHGGWLSMEHRSLEEEPDSEEGGSGSIQRRPSEHLTLDRVAAVFAAAVGAEFPATCEGNPVALANEAVRRAVQFLEGPLMPLSVACLPAAPAASPAASPPSSLLESQLSEADKAIASKELQSREQIFRELKEVARCMHEVLSNGSKDCNTSSICQGVDHHPAHDSELSGCELRVALLLSLDLSLWTSALCPEEAPKAEPPPSPKLSMPPLMLTELLVMECPAVQTPGAQAWTALKPLLELERLPPLLRYQVATLRAQCADLLTRDNVHEVSDCRGRTCSTRGCCD